MNRMVLPQSLMQRCVAVFHNHAKKVLNRGSKDDKVEQSVQFALQRLVTVFNLWHSLSFIRRYQNAGSKWTIRVQDVNSQESARSTIYIQSPAEFKRFEAYLRHLTANWFKDIKVQKLQNGSLSFIVTHPAVVVLHIFPGSQTSSDEYSTSKGSDSEMVLQVLCGLLEDFCLHSLIDSEVRSKHEAKKYKDKESTRSQSPDETSVFQGRNDTFTAGSYIPPDVLLQQLEQAYVLVSDDGKNSQSRCEEQSSAQKQSSEVEYLKAQNAKLKKSFHAMAYELQKQRTVLQSQINELEDQTKKMAVIIEQKDAEIQETLSELGRVSVEFTRVLNEVKKKKQFNKTYKTQAASTQTSEVLPSTSGASVSSHPISSTETNRAEARYDQVDSTQEHCHEQESLNETASLSDIPHTGVDGNTYNNYKLLLLQISGNLLKEDVLKLKQWVQTEFALDASTNVNEILLELDRKKIISVTDLSRLKKFFEENVRYDLVHLIDCFLRGDYGYLRPFKCSERSGSFNRGSSAQNTLATQRFLPVSGWSRGCPFGLLQGPADQSPSDAPGSQRKFQELSRATEAQIGNGASSTQQPTQHNAPGSHTRQSRPVAAQDLLTISAPSKAAVRNLTNTTPQGVVVTDSGRREEGEVQTNSSQERQVSPPRYADPRSNGQRLSRFQRPDSSERTETQRRGSRGEDYDSQWLCSHYKRRCYVKFECCDQFWPCHRCHNNQSSCGRRKLKSRDTQQIKCAACGLEQPFAQYCTRCNAKFAKYFCGLCKHLTGTDENPYHCEKCGICRIHGDRSFHCDICAGVCLDVQLHENHRCREGSTHDECGICLEDAFGGHQIFLPCPHNETGESGEAMAERQDLNNEQGDSREESTSSLLGQTQSRRNINEEDSTVVQSSNGQNASLREPLADQSLTQEIDTNDQGNLGPSATSSPSGTLLIQAIPHSLDVVEEWLLAAMVKPKDYRRC